MVVQRVLKPVKILYNFLSYKFTRSLHPGFLNVLKKEVKAVFVWLVSVSSICQLLCSALLKIFIIFRATEVRVYR